MPQTTNRVLFIGAGRMAQAIISTLAEKEQFDILVTNKGNKTRLEYVQNTYRVPVTEDWKQQLNKIDIIFLAMPPEDHEQILKEIYRLINGQLVITVAAGIDPAYLEARLPDGTPTAWVMPNTAAKLGESSTLYAIGTHVEKQYVKVLEEILSGIGAFEKVTEQQLHQLTAITGSAPAFIYRITESLKNQAQETGITEEQARKLVAQMIAGSAELLKTGEDPAALAGQVATPGGSTAAGLGVLDNHNVDSLLREAIEACRRKAGNS
ncbi:pyrroline-5-carboxylate reductase [Sediminibacillus albus]|uniref:Pyrroline-5-carboxylate reductase n=1 Tax=Sediminibacillus albus TaxID=407036 RepID=A0A1G9ANT6_9BACI|nr:pyrroline-5-carboxylate reductase [Sediminibacillus albus]SDK29046.1 pyrroline-5-carboxylate reductase [Sediminibacillus albus]